MSCFVQCMINTNKAAFTGVSGPVVEHQPHNHKVLSLIPRHRCQVRGCSLAYTFVASTGVVPRKQNQARLENVCKLGPVLSQ